MIDAASDEIARIPVAASGVHRIQRADLIDRYTQSPAEQHGEAQANRESEQWWSTGFSPTQTRGSARRRATRQSPCARRTLGCGANTGSCARHNKSNHRNEGARETEREEHLGAPARRIHTCALPSCCAQEALHEDHGQVGIRGSQLFANARHDRIARLRCGRARVDEHARGIGGPRWHIDMRLGPVFKRIRVSPRARGRR